MRSDRLPIDFCRPCFLLTKALAPTRGVRVESKPVEPLSDRFACRRARERGDRRRKTDSVGFCR